MSSTRLAIIIPFFKIEFFEDTLKSISNQTNKNFNLYIGNDNSPTDPLNMIKKHLADTSYEYFEFKNNLGRENLALQWSRIINKTKNEEYLYILGDDDYISDNFVEEFYKVIKLSKQKMHLIRFPAVLIDYQGKPLKSRSTYPVKEDFVSFTNKLFDGKIRSSLSENIFSREAYNKFGFCLYPLAWFTDTKLWLDINYLYETISINNATVYTRMSNKNISGDRSLYKVKLLSGLLYHLDVINGFKLESNTYKNVEKKLIYFLNKNIYINKKIILKFLRSEISTKLKIRFFLKLIYKAFKYKGEYKRNNISKTIKYYES